MLVLYLADRTGTHINDMVQGSVNALFTLFMNGDILFLNFFITPFAMDSLVITGLICLPESVISHDVTLPCCRPCAPFLPFLSFPL